MPFNLGLPELLVLFVLGLLIFGPKKLPELGRSLGESILNFKKSLTKESSEEKEESKKTEEDSIKNIEDKKN